MESVPTAHQRLPPPAALFDRQRQLSAATDVQQWRPSMLHERHTKPAMLSHSPPEYRQLVVEKQQGLADRLPTSRASEPHPTYVTAAPPATASVAFSPPRDEANAVDPYWSHRRAPIPSTHQYHHHHYQQHHHQHPQAIPNHHPHWGFSGQPIPVAGYPRQFEDLTDYPSSDARKKRLRNSRSCAECQRRKTRCDAVGVLAADAAHEPEADRERSASAAEGDMIVVQPCTNCSRSGVPCQYSKRPAKRGPSKGYIKDLESRLYDLESHRHTYTHNHALEPTSDDGTRGPSSIGQEDDHKHHDSASDHDGPTTPPSASSNKRSTRPWELESSGDEESDACTPNIGKRDKSDDDRIGGSDKDNVAQHAQQKDDCVDVANAMVSLGKAAHKASESPTVELTPPQKVVDWTADHVANESQPAPSHASPSDPRKHFAQSAINGTFGIRPLDDDNTDPNPANTHGMDDRLVLRAMRLLAEPAGQPPRPPSSAVTSRMSTPASFVGIEHSSNVISNGLKHRPITRKSHSARLGQLQGQCMTGAKFNAADGLLSSTVSGVAALVAARKVRAALSSIEGEALLLCYLDGLRHGNPDNSALAAACSKLSSSSSGGGSLSDRNGPASASVDATHDELRRNSALYAIDRWHSAFFNTTHAFSGRSVPDESSLCRQIEALKREHHDGPLHETPAEVLRAAVMFDALQHMADARGGYKSVTLSHCESIIHSAGAANDRLDTSSTPRSPSSTSSSPSFAERTDNDAACSARGNLYTAHALRSGLRGAFILFYRLQTLPSSENLTQESLVTILEAVEGCVLAGPSRTPLDPQTLLMRSFIGPFVFALATAALSWLARAIALVARRSLDAAVEDNLTRLAYLRTKSQDYARMLGPLCVFAAGSGSTLQPLWLRIAAYNHTNVSYLSLLTGIVSHRGPDLQSVDADSPLRDSQSTLQQEVDGRASLIQDMGPLGLVLASTTAREALDLLPNSE